MRYFYQERIHIIITLDDKLFFHKILFYEKREIQVLKFLTKAKTKESLTAYLPVGITCIPFFISNDSFKNLLQCQPNAFFYYAL